MFPVKSTFAVLCALASAGIPTESEAGLFGQKVCGSLCGCGHYPLAHHGLARCGFGPNYCGHCHGHAFHAHVYHGYPYHPGHPVCCPPPFCGCARPYCGVHHPLFECAYNHGIRCGCGHRHVVHSAHRGYRHHLSLYAAR